MSASFCFSDFTRFDYCTKKLSVSNSQGQTRQQRLFSDYFDQKKIRGLQEISYAPTPNIVLFFVPQSWINLILDLS